MPRTPHLALLLVTGVLGLAACGGNDDVGAAATATPTTAQTPPPIVTQAAAPAITVTDATPVPTASAAATAIATASATQTPAATAPPKAANARTSTPLECMKRAKLNRARKRAKHLWVGEERKTGEEVIVDGPYKTVDKARSAAESQKEIANAESGGRYVVSAALTGHVESSVHQVASCLGRR